MRAAYPPIRAELLQYRKLTFLDLPTWICPVKSFLNLEYFYRILSGGNTIKAETNDHLKLAVLGLCVKRARGDWVMLFSPFLLALSSVARCRPALMELGIETHLRSVDAHGTI
jgi:hypothetical protein